MDGLCNESGGHRVQRVPPTERKGRVHTSTVTVAIIDPAITKSRQFCDNEFRVEWYSGTGAGGQHRNKHQNSCRIVHIPTGKIATAQCRSRVSSLDTAKSSLLEELMAFNNMEEKNVIDAHRKGQVGSGMRGDKIRTYRFQDDIIIDHRTNEKYSAKKILSGYFDLMW